MQASLAVAEERLRFARDLHDVVGRSLSVVALKAELAAQLGRRGRAEAVDEMLAVRRIAQDSLVELRAVVGGYRRADLAVELAGARSLLASAGIDCQVVGDGSGLPTQVQGALGWVVREAATNVLRHSEARCCTITLLPAGDAVALTMDNDGAGEARAAQAATGAEALALARALRPDVAILDLQLPDVDGVAVATALHGEVPGCRTMIVTSHGLPGHLKRALTAGVRGFLPKTVSAETLAAVVRAVHGGGRYVDPQLAAEAISAGDSPLTPREADVLALAAEGAPVDEIAQRAALSPGTVRNYLSSAVSKVGGANRHEAARIARGYGWI